MSRIIRFKGKRRPQMAGENQIDAMYLQNICA